MKRYTAKSDKKTAYGADGRVYAIDEMTCDRCDHPFIPHKSKSPCNMCLSNPQRIHGVKFCGYEFTPCTHKETTHKETIEQPASIDGEVLVRCKKCGIVKRSYYLGEKVN